MSALANLNHERFCQAVHARMASGEKRVSAIAEAYVDTIYEGDKVDRAKTVAACGPNARRMCNTRKEVAARITELADYAAKLAGIDAGWALLKLKKLADSVEDFNLDDYLGPPDRDGNRYYDLGAVSRDLMARLSEMTIEETAEGGSKSRRILRKVKLKGPAKETALPSIIAVMARIAGWEAPKKIAPTDAEGKTLTLEQLVGASMLVRPAEPKAEAA